MSAAPLLIVWPEYPPAVGGMQVHGFEFARFLRDARYPFVLITRAPATGAQAAEAAAFDAAVGIEPARILPRADFSGALATLARLARAVRPQAVYSSQIAYAPAFDGVARVVCRSAGNDVLRPWVGPYDVSDRSISASEGVTRVQANREWIRTAADACAGVLCNSEWTASRLRLLLSAPVTVVRGGVDVRHFRPVRRERLRSVLPWARDHMLAVIAARHVLKKGIDVALDAMALVGDGIKLIVAGSGPETAALVARHRRLGLKDRVRFIGPADRDALACLLAMADVMLVPSRSVYDPRKFGTDHETMCRVACEAAACGTPVIASSCGGLPEIVKDGQTGFLVAPDDAAALARTILRLAGDTPLRESLSARARQWAVDELSFERVNQATLAALCDPPRPAGRATRDASCHPVIGA